MAQTDISETFQSTPIVDTARVHWSVQKKTPSVYQKKLWTDRQHA